VDRCTFLLRQTSPIADPSSPGRRRLLAAAGAAVAAGAGAACTATEPMRVGFLGGLSGRVSDLGIGSRNGAQLAIDDLNAAGGLAGRPLELVIRDDEQSADLARQRLNELCDLGVAFIIGPITSTSAVELLPSINQRRVPVISPLAGANALSSQDDAFFRVVSDTASSAYQQAEALLARGLRRAVTVGDAKNPVFSQNWVDSASKHFTAAGGVVVQSLSFEGAPGLKFVELAQQIARSGADCAIFVANAADSAVLAQQVRRLRASMVIALSAWAGTEVFPTLGGPALDGVMVTQFFDRFNATPRWLDFAARYTKRFGENPGYPGMHGYDAVQMGAAAVRAAGRDGVLQALRQIRELEGLQRKLRFDEFGDCIVPTYLTVVKGGRYIAVPA
jgi:branched-chain amino acid transport system substrate-binding protein